MWMRMHGSLFDLVLANQTVSSLIWNARIHARIWKVPIHRRLIATTWDLTSLCMKRALDRHMPRGSFRFLDMGCGQVALLAQYAKLRRPLAQVTAIDIYPDFVANSRFNAERNGLAIEVRTGDLFEGLGEQFDLIAFNPPYYPEPEHVAYKYKHARYAGPDGMDAMRRFLAAARSHLALSGKILLGLSSAVVPLERCLALVEGAGYAVEDIVRRRLNASRVLLLSGNGRDGHRDIRKGDP
jgi:methylase of polypeptide subunit release factors